VDHALLLLDTVAIVEAVGNRDFEEARFRCRQVGNRAWSENEAKVGNAAINLEVALRHAETSPTVKWGRSLEDLTSAVDAFLQPQRDYLLAAFRDGGN
jgi:hypothetical protein